MLIDFHVHVWPHSSCSNMKLEETILQAKSIGLDGICLTDHNYIWDRALIEKYREELSFKIFRGMEIAAPHGHFLLFGAERIPTIFSLNDLEILSANPDYFCIFAHPFRTLSNYQIQNVGAKNSNLEYHRLFTVVSAVEVYNGSNSQKDDILGEGLVQSMVLKATGGSDAHALQEIGLCLTELENDVDTETELIKELKAGRFRAKKRSNNQ